MLGKLSLTVFAVFRRVLTRLRTAEAQSLATVGNSVFTAESRVLSRRERGAIVVGDNCHIKGELFVFPHAGQIRIGHWVYLGPGSTIWSSSPGGVSIGSGVLISSNVHIHDTDGHPQNAVKRFAQTQAILTTGHPRQISDIDAAPIVIGDDAWIGFNVAILKGVTIGEGAIVGAGSVVTKDVPPYTVVAGNPARVIKEVKRTDG